MLLLKHHGWSDSQLFRHSIIRRYCSSTGTLQDKNYSKIQLKYLMVLLSLVLMKQEPLYSLIPLMLMHQDRRFWQLWTILVHSLRWQLRATNAVWDFIDFLHLSKKFSLHFFDRLNILVYFLKFSASILCMDYGAFTNKMLASNKLKYSKTLAFPKAYYESIPNLGQSVVYFGDKLRTKYAFCDFQ